MQAIKRTFGILRIIAQQNGQIGVSRIAKQLELPKSTISRFLVALEAEGMVSRSPENLFSLGTELLELTSKRTFANSLVAIARPELLALNQQTGEAVGLSVLDGYNVTYLDHIASHHVVQVVDWTGRSVPLHVSSSGKLFLAASSAEFLKAYFQPPLEAFTSHTIVTGRSLKEHLTTIARQDFALSDEEFALGVIGYAVPIRDVTGTIIAAITLYGPKFRLTELDQRHNIIALLRKSCTAIERQLHRSTSRFPVAD